MKNVNKTPRSANDKKYVFEYENVLKNARLIDGRDGALLLQALNQIREMGYNSQAFMATDTVLSCIRVAEAAIGELESRDVPRQDAEQNA